MMSDAKNMYFYVNIKSRAFKFALLIDTIIIIIILFESGNMAHTQTHTDIQTDRQTDIISKKSNAKKIGLLIH